MLSSMKRTIVQLIDDVDGSEASETVKFALDNSAYSIDLSGKNAAKLRKTLDPYIAVATKVTVTRTMLAGKPGRQRADAKARNTQIREWAKTQGIVLPERGRIATDIQNKYDAAMKAA